MKTFLKPMRRIADLLFPLAVVLLFCRPGAAIGAERRVLSGRIPASISTAGLAPLGPAPSRDALTLSIGVLPRHTNELDQFIEDLYNPAHPQFRRYLTPDEFAERFGPTREDYEAVIGFARAHHLEVTATHPNRLLLDVRGAVADVEEAFKVRMKLFPRPGGGVFHAPDAEPSVDANLPIETVSGLNDAQSPRPMLRKGPAARRAVANGSSGSYPSAGFTAADLRAAYLPGVTLTGAGQAVALVEFDGFYTNDITLYESRNGLPAVPVPTVLLNGFNGTPGYWNLEVALDAEAAIAVAPGLDRVILYEIQPYGAANSLLNRIATDNAARQISCSWSFASDSTTEKIFKQFAAQGQSLLVSSADLDAWPSPFLSAVDGVTSGVTQPQDSPNATLVGGTSLSTSGPAGPWTTERVWNMGFQFPHYWGTGGGVSPTYALPSWQNGVANTVNRASATKRNMPDVAMVAENVLFTYNNGELGSIVGTSISAPLFAGYIALANELAQSLGKPPLGFLNPALYRLGAGPTYATLFHDITNGNNATSANPTNYFAVPGYDLCTGWGTPKGSNLLYALALPEPLVISPGLDMTIAGPVGGPFTPGSQTFALTNTGSALLHWALGGLPGWLDASVTAGSLAPSDPAAGIVVSINDAAAQLSAGTYSATLGFTNTDDGGVQSRSVTLLVAEKPKVAVQPSTQTAIAGSTVTLTASASGNPPMAFQWWHGGTELGSAVGPVLTLTNLTAADAGVYSVSVTNGFGSAVSAEVSLTVTPAAVPGVSLELLHTFTGGVDGANPMNVVWGKDGGLYGTAYSGGGNKYGSIFRIAGDGTFAPLYSFPTGGFPLDGLIPGGSGNFLGVTYASGSSACGTVFSLTPNAAYRVLHNFTGGGNGRNPAAALTLAADGNYYGVTSAGGDSTLDAGIIYRITPTGVWSLVHTFKAGEGAGPNSRLTAGRDGYLYGTTTTAGASPNDGTIFRIATNGVFTTLVKWHGTNGFSPSGPLSEGADGRFYGLAWGGETGLGVAYRMSPAGDIAIIHTFQGLDDGSLSGFRDGGLTLASDGNFYGTTGGNGANGAVGTVFRLTPDGQLTTLASFNGANGANPVGSLVPGPDGYFYGSTANGGAFGYGTIFRLGVFPRLEVSTSADGLTLSWPAWASNFTLQQRSDPANGAWGDVVAAPGVTLDGQRFFTKLPFPASDSFYRLQQK